MRAATEDILDGLRAQPGRLGLAVLAIGVGIASLTVLLAVLGGLAEQSKRIVDQLGANVFAVSQESPSGQNRPLAYEHVELLQGNLPGFEIAGIKRHAAPGGGPRGDTIKIVATDGPLQSLRQWRMIDGRFIDARDVADRSRVAVITPALGRERDWRVGDAITLGQVAFRIVGLVQSGGESLEQDGAGASLAFGEKVAFVPSRTPPYWQRLGNRPDQGVDTLFVRVPAGRPVPDGVARVQALLAQPDLRLAGLAWITPRRMLARVHRLQRTIQFTVGSISLLCLVLGGTTLMSLMVANVNERVTEIGLRRALGATPRDISTLFVVEACLVTAFAACLGTLVTHALLLAFRDRLPVDIRLGWDTLLVPLAVATVLGMAFAWWPARTAARIAPSEALRND